MVSINFPNAARSVNEKILEFHLWLLAYVLPILWTIISLLFLIASCSYSFRGLIERHSTELGWTVIPRGVLLPIRIPSLKLLYLMDERGGNKRTIKAIGHQWYWQYDYPELPSFLSYIIGGDYRVLNADNRLMLITGIPAQILISAADVLHSWTVPTIGIKADAVPGRVNKLNLIPKRPGVYFGQCSEICGSNHRFIPISLESYIFNF